MNMRLMGQRIRAARARVGLTQAALAAKASIGRSTLQRIEKGIADPTLLVLVKIHFALSPKISFVNWLDAMTTPRKRGKTRGTPPGFLVSFVYGQLADVLERDPLRGNMILRSLFKNGLKATPVPRPAGAKCNPTNNFWKVEGEIFIGGDIRFSDLVKSAPRATRTPDPQVRSLVLYPAELWVLTRVEYPEILDRARLLLVAAHADSPSKVLAEADLAANTLLVGSDPAFEEVG